MDLGLWLDRGELRPVTEDDMDVADMRATRGSRGGAAEEEVLIWGGIGGEKLPPLLLVPTSDSDRVGVW